MPRDVFAGERKTNFVLRFAVSYPQKKYSTFIDIWRNNRSFLRDRHVFADEYADFVLRVLRAPAVRDADDARDTITGAPSMQYLALQLATRYFFEQLVYAKEKTMLASWVAELTAIYARNVPAQRWYIVNCGS